MVGAFKLFPESIYGRIDTVNRQNPGIQQFPELTDIFADQTG